MEITNFLKVIKLTDRRRGVCVQTLTSDAYNFITSLTMLRVVSNEHHVILFYFQLWGTEWFNRMVIYDPTRFFSLSQGHIVQQWLAQNSQNHVTLTYDHLSFLVECLRQYLGAQTVPHTLNNTIVNLIDDTDKKHLIWECHHFQCCIKGVFDA